MKCANPKCSKKLETKATNKKYCSAICRRRYNNLVYTKRHPEVGLKWLKKNSNKMTLYKKNYNKKNRQKYKESAKKSDNKRSEKINNARFFSRYLRQRLMFEELPDYYIKYLLVHSGYNRNDIKPEIVEQRKLSLKIKRIAYEKQRKIKPSGNHVSVK